jgi:hypothetical protein
LNILHSCPHLLNPLNMTFLYQILCWLGKVTLIHSSVSKEHDFNC